LEEGERELLGVPGRCNTKHEALGRAQMAGSKGPCGQGRVGQQSKRREYSTNQTFSTTETWQRDEGP
jgi:hypothetical protein